MMKKIITALKARWFITLIGAILLSLFIFFIGPLLGFGDTRPFATLIVRIIFIGVIFCIWSGLLVFYFYRAKKSNRQFIDDIANDSNLDDSSESNEEIAILNRSLQEALSTLKKTKVGGKGRGQHLYELPWYILIGPPGSGKTTALINSGLNFPLVDVNGREPLRGVGGTRNCDWWFTNEAVLLDTAGRFTTQDSQQSRDRGAWLGFLSLLKKHRPRQPINGALVAISVTELMRPDAERKSLARTIRQRIGELHEELGVRFPIYVLVTKLDLISGFLEYFDDLGQSDREQVWGVTFPIDDDPSSDILKALHGEFDRLISRLTDRGIERVHQEPDPARRAAIFSFPAQIASLRTATNDFIEEIFRSSRYDEKPLLRGVYLTSGTQEGTPVDRVMSALAAQFRVERRQLAAHHGRGRSYFLTSLLRNVIFPEASLVSANRRLERRKSLCKRLSISVASAAVVLLSVLWFLSYQGNIGLIERVDQSLVKYRGEVRELAIDNIVGPELSRALQPLETLRNVPAGYADKDKPVPFLLTAGLYQGDEIGSAASAAYSTALNRIMLPRLLLRLEEQLSQNIRKPQYLYEGLKVYLMLGGQGPLDASLVREWFRIDWQTVYPGQDNAQGRAALLAHLDALVEKPVLPIPLNGALVENVRRVVGTMSLADRVYSRIKLSAAARQAVPWRILDHAGSDANRVFIRRSNRSLYDGIPGLFTREGFHKVFSEALDQSARELGAETWVMGQKNDKKNLSAKELRALKRKVSIIYENDYAAHWDTYLSDITITQFKNINDAADILNILSGPNSPIRSTLLAIASETDLEKSISEKGRTKAVSAAKGAAQGEPQRSALSNRLNNVIGSSALTNLESYRPGKIVSDKFRPLHDFVRGREGAAPPIEGLIRRLNDLYSDISRATSSLSQDEMVREFSQGKAGREAIRQLSIAASRVPAPINGWLSSTTITSSRVLVESARSKLNSIWSANVGPFCRRALDNRFPFDKNSKADVALDDFKKMFAPSGLLDEFFNAHLKPFVNRSSRPWRWQKVDNANLGVPESVLTQFEIAADIRAAFFGNGQTPLIQFEVTPTELSAEATRVILEVEGQTLSYGHGPQRPVRMKWPGPKPGITRIALSPITPGRQSALTNRGPWSWFHSLSRATVTGTRMQDQIQVKFNVGARAAQFQIRSESVVNPFDLPALGRFKCPRAL